MPVTDKHRSYDEAKLNWQSARDCIEGEAAVKKRGTEYLPMLGGQATGAYDGYKGRAMFYGATGRTVQGLQGCIFRLDPEIKLPSAISSLEKDVDGSGSSLTTFSKKVTSEVLAAGRYGMLTDVPPLKPGSAVRPFIVGYTAETIINWRVKSTGEGWYLDQVVLEEEFETDAADGFGSAYEVKYRVLDLLDGKYRIRIFVKQEANGQEDWVQEGDDVFPIVRGAQMDFIPFCFVGPSDLTPEIEKSPIQDLVSVNLSHYRTSADLEHGCHWTALPTPWVAGYKGDDKLTIGGGIAWNLGANGQAGMLEFTGAGLKALEARIASKEDLMVKLGARLLEDQKKGAETAESKRLQYSGENSILSTLAKTVSDGIKKNLEWARDWSVTTGEITFELNTDFFDADLSPEELKALVDAWQKAAISKETLVFNIKRGELLPPGVSVDEEISKIDAEGPVLSDVQPKAEPVDPKLEPAKVLA